MADPTMRSMDRIARADQRRVRWVALSVGAVAFCLLLAGLWLLFLDRSRPFPADRPAWSSAAVGSSIAALGVCVLGSLIAVKRPANAIGWIFLVAGSTLALGDFEPHLAR